MAVGLTVLKVRGLRGGALARMERGRKPVKCPRCGFSPVAEVLYGEPSCSDKLEKEIASSRIILGGCLLTLDGPVWQCGFCNLKIFLKKE